MAYQRVTLQQLKDRLRERLAEFDKFWSEPAQEAALNEAIMVWQLLTADYPQKEEIALNTPTTIIKPTLMERPATFLRIRCKPEVTPPPITYVLGGQVIHDEENTPINGVTVSLYSVDDTVTPIDTTTTAYSETFTDDGWYTFDVEDGSYYVRATSVVPLGAVWASATVEGADVYLDSIKLNDPESPAWPPV